MSASHEQTDGAALIQRFERNDIGEEPFHHSDHVRLAFEYLLAYPVLEALGRFSAALRRFADARGKTDLYNETVTFAYLFLIHERMARVPETGWEAFANANSDLMVWKNSILSGYYHPTTLRSDLARRVFVLPDKMREA
jgi:hypothetical protein